MFSLRLLSCALVLPLLAACENGATSMLVDGKDHAVILVREQSVFWNNEVTQYIIVSRLPDCQRRIRIHPDKTGMAAIDAYEAGHWLWALHQNGRWYLASTEECRVQDWNNASGQPPGPAVGSFRQVDGKVAFVPAKQKTP